MTKTPLFIIGLSFIFLFIFIHPSKITAVTVACSPFRAHVVAIENNRDCIDIRADSGCGGALDVLNHCPASFYVYEDDNSSDFLTLGNYEKEIGSDAHEILSVWIPKNSVFIPDCPHDSVSVCFGSDNPKGYENVPNNTVVKNWILTLKPVTDGKPTIVHGQTVYEKPLPKILSLPSLLMVALICFDLFMFVLGFILLFTKVKNIVPTQRKVVALSCFLISGLLAILLCVPLLSF